MSEYFDHNRPFLRLREIVSPFGPVPYAKSAWWEGVRSGRFPQPLKFGPRTTVWRREDIEALLDSFNRA